MDANGRAETTSRAGRMIAWLERLAGSAWFAYGSIALIQAKVMWGIWDHRDLSPGDTGAYFVMASRWADDLKVEPAFYPLYHGLWGSLQWLVSDPYSVTILHRVLIGLGTTLLLLAVLRRLLTPGIAWVLALWWAILPINYDVLYEIHLFGALAGLAIALVALRSTGLTGRAVVFGLLLASAILVRNENIVAAFAFGAVWLGYELWRFRRGTAPPLGRIAAAAVIPVVAVAALAGLIAWRSADDDSFFEQFRGKHQLNICQVYAQGLWQSGDVRVDNPHAQCHVYTREDFGIDEPSLLEAVAENPGAMARHFARNAGLVPAGLQIDLFNAKFGSTSDEDNPDYIPVNEGSWLVLAGSILVLGLVGAGALLLWRERRMWWNDWIRERVWGWVAMGAVATSALYAALLTRPRPSYMFPLSAFIFALIGMSLLVIANRLGVPRRARAVIAPLAAVALIAIPFHYRPGYENPQIGPGQRLKLAVERLEPFEEELEGRETGLLGVYPVTGACEYVTRTEPCRPVSWNHPIGENLEPELEGKEQDSTLGAIPINLIYADEYAFAADPGIRAQLESLQRRGWRRLAPVSGNADWMLLAREPEGTSS